MWDLRLTALGPYHMEDRGCDARASSNSSLFTKADRNKNPPFVCLFCKHSRNWIAALSDVLSIQQEGDDPLVSHTITFGLRHLGDENLLMANLMSSADSVCGIPAILKNRDEKLRMVTQPAAVPTGDIAALWE